MGERISFVEWALHAVPMVIILLPIAFALVIKVAGGEAVELKEAGATLERRIAAMGRLRLDEGLVGTVMALAVAAWILGGERWGLGPVALAASAMLFALGLVRWRDVEELVDWGIIFMYGGAIALGAALSRTDAAAWLAHQALDPELGSKATVLAIAAASMLATEVMFQFRGRRHAPPCGVDLFGAARHRAQARRVRDGDPGRPRFLSTHGSAGSRHRLLRPLLQGRPRHRSRLGHERQRVGQLRARGLRGLAAFRACTLAPEATNRWLPGGVAPDRRSAPGWH